MDWDEISTRLGQEIHKRGDLARYRLGVGPAAIRIRSVAGEGKFFFPPSEVAKRAQLLQRALPERAAEIIGEADEICGHHFRLLGYDNLDLGTEIDWHLDRVHNKHSRLDPWFKIPFLDFGVAGDHKVIWELNRHQHLVTLAKAWLLTRDKEYVRELMGQWRSWMKANPYPLGINWGSTLEVGFRSLSWIWVDHLIFGAEGYGQFREELMPALAFHGRYIERYLSTYFSPNTHLLGEALAMFFLGTLYPEMPGAPRWKKCGWDTVVREAGRQVRPDGVYFEQSLYYHVYALDFFLYARELAAVNDLPIPAGYDGVLLAMLDVVEALAQAGPAEGFGDDDGGRLFDPQRNRTEHLVDPLALGVLAYNRDDLSAARLTEESIWLFGERAVRELRGPRSCPAPVSVAFPDGGIYVIADSSPFLQTMMIDAGPMGAGRCGHGHADALSVRLTINGRRWLVDSGAGVYVGPDALKRDFLRGTAAHNTIRVDGVDQATAEGPFSWTNVPSSRADRWIAGKSFTYFSGSHDGYKRLADPVVHRRSVLRLSTSESEVLWLIRDVLEGGAEHEIEHNWHFAKEISIHPVSESEFLASGDEADPVRLRVILSAESGWQTEVVEGGVSPAYGRYETVPVLRSRGRVKLPVEFGTVFAVRSQNASPRPELRMNSTASPLIQTYELANQEERHEFLFARSKQKWTTGPWASDAEVIYCRTRGHRITQLLVIGATEISWEEKPLLETREPLEFFEWRGSDGLRNGAPPPVATTRWFDELTQTPKSTSHSSTSSPYVEKH